MKASNCKAINDFNLKKLVLVIDFKLKIYLIFKIMNKI